MPSGEPNRADTRSKGMKIRKRVGRTRDVRGNGIVVRLSRQSFKETVTRLEHAAAGTGAQLFGRIDHSANAKRVGLALEPMEVLIFGRPQASTLLMQQQPTTGLDLPLKILVWREDDQVWIAYNDIGYLALRHGVTDTPDALAAMHRWFDAVVEAATS